jgi:hypothetical protein
VLLRLAPPLRGQPLPRDQSIGYLLCTLPPRASVQRSGRASVRRDFRVLLSDAGVPLEAISQLVGHSGTSVTEHREDPLVAEALPLDQALAAGDNVTAFVRNPANAAGPSRSPSPVSRTRPPGRRAQRPPTACKNCMKALAKLGVGGAEGRHGRGSRPGWPNWSPGSRRRSVQQAGHLSGTSPSDSAARRSRRRLSTAGRRQDRRG